MSVGRSYCFTAPTSGTLTEVIPVPAGCSKARILDARIASDTVMSGAETFTLQKGSTVISTAIMADAAAVADFVKSSTAADAHSEITSGGVIATGALSLVIPEMDAAYTLVLDILWDDHVAPLS